MAEIALEGARKLRENAEALRKSMEELRSTRPAFHADMEKILSNLPKPEITEVPSVSPAQPDEAELTPRERDARELASRLLASRAFRKWLGEPTSDAGVVAWAEALTRAMIRRESEHGGQLFGEEEEEEEEAIEESPSETRHEP